MLGSERIQRHWQLFAECRGMPTAWFFPEGGMETRNAARRGRSTDPYERGRRVCRRCSVWKACLTYAVATGQEDGLWGGLDPAEIAGIGREFVVLRHRLREMNYDHPDVATPECFSDW